MTLPFGARDELKMLQHRLRVLGVDADCVTVNVREDIVRVRIPKDYHRIPDLLTELWQLTVE